MSSSIQAWSFGFSAAFAVALGLGFVLRLWLTSRQVRHVVQHRGAVPGAYAQSISLEDHQKAADYTVAKARLGVWGLALGTIVTLGWTLFGGLQLLNEVLVGTLGHSFWQQIALVIAFAFIGSLIDLPLDWYGTFRLEGRFGFNKMTTKLWLMDLLKGTLLGLALGLPILALIIYLMQAAGNLWWLWAWGALVVFQLFVMWIAPTWIMPLFYKFTPLEDGEVKTRANALMQRCGFKASGFYVMDGSKRSAHSNAFFTGFGNTKRVVFFDTLLQQLSVDEMEAVLAHELGHFKHKHIIKRMATGFLSTLAGLALLGWLSNQLWFYAGLGVTPSLMQGNQALALILFMIAVPTFLFFTAPISAYFSRKDEFQADAYACAHASGASLKAALVKLYKDNASTLTPDPLFVKWTYSHPPATQRLSKMEG
jgi:STE24 endopeptidase